ncbi:MAG: beta-glucosidase, partial [Bacteroidetes bacterium]|nr:beta-glucosidase [Bacteroidota bacterium]
MNRKIIKYLVLGLCLFTLFSCDQKSEDAALNDEIPLYMETSQPVEKRVEDLMARMTLEDKVYQMNQFVGLDHMRRAEKNLTIEELHNND